MDVFTFLIGVALIAVAIYLFYRQRAPSDVKSAAPIGFPGQPARAQAAATTPSEPSLRDLRPGDAITFWDIGEQVVQSVLQCQEEVSGRLTRWQWALLDGGGVVEASLEGLRLYVEPEIVHQGTAVYEGIVPPAGALGRFEEHVRAGTVGSQPVYFDHGGRTYKVASTGTFAAALLGAAPEGEVWRDVSTNPSENVYFELELVPDPAPQGNGHGKTAVGESATEEQLLGIWTSHIWLGKGKKLKESDVTGLYAGRR